MKSFITALVLSALLIGSAFAGDEHLFWIKVSLPGAGNRIEAWVTTNSNGITALHVDSESGSVSQLRAGKYFPRQKLTVKALPGFTAEKGGQIQVSYPLGSKTIELRDEGAWHAYLMPANQRINNVSISVMGVSIR